MLSATCRPYPARGPALAPTGHLEDSPRPALAERGRAVADYLEGVYADDQRIAQEQGYATLPSDLLAKVAASAAAVR
jgi:hypothetical protein